MSQLSTEDVRFALNLAQENGFAEVHLSSELGEFRAELPPRPRPAATAPAVVAAPIPLFVKSSFVGLFKPASPAIEIGSIVTAGQAVGAVETLGLLNDVESRVAGTVSVVHVNSDDPVDYGKVLFTVEP